jgi:hypothetical protein
MKFLYGMLEMSCILSYVPKHLFNFDMMLFYIYCFMCKSVCFTTVVKHAVCTPLWLVWEHVIWRDCGSSHCDVFCCNQKISHGTTHSLSPYGFQSRDEDKNGEQFGVWQTSGYNASDKATGAPRSESDFGNRILRNFLFSTVWLG